MEQKIFDLMQQALMTVMLTSAPMLLMGLVVGLIVSIFQTVTSIQEQTLAFVPKILAVFLAIIIFGPWISTNMKELFVDLYSNFSYYLVD